MKSLGILMSILLSYPQALGALEFGLLEDERLVYGTVRHPNSSLSYEAGNRYSEVNFQYGVTFFRFGKLDLQTYARYSRFNDSQGNLWNNQTGYTIGLRSEFQLSEGLMFYLDYSDNHFERKDGKPVKYHTTTLGYDYYHQWWVDRPMHLDWLRLKKLVMKHYGKIEYPASGEEDDQNLSFEPGSELAIYYGFTHTKFELAPFVTANLAFDKEKLEAYNKFRLGYGLKLLWPLEGGEVYAKLGLEEEFHWLSGEKGRSPQFEFGWYIAF